MLVEILEFDELELRIGPVGSLWIDYAVDEVLSAWRRFVWLSGLCTLFHRNMENRSIWSK
jgi:hypothetical protein